MHFPPRLPFHTLTFRGLISFYTVCNFGRRRISSVRATPYCGHKVGSRLGLICVFSFGCSLRNSTHTTTAPPSPFFTAMIMLFYIIVVLRIDFILFTTAPPH